ncbi:DUF6020 family protein [Butyrivibrio sp. NC2002]|uniref:DUF6020 family protein n=1 Tax=Butyrivibrio sp. NC2002 TaxID=1410610 RepID=UPI000562395F|nr:DUF6020 family protein [Butyrivibrio sp. NC2002]
MPQKKKQSKDMVIAALFGLVLSMSLVFGYQLEKYDHLIFADKRIYILIPVLAAVIAFISFKSLDYFCEKAGITDKIGLGRGYNRNEFIKVWMIIALCHFIVLLGVYPGFFVYDAQTEVMEVITRSFNAHHPLLHVLLLGGSLAFFHKFTGSYNAGIFAYTLVQMLVMTAIFTYILSFMKMHGAGEKLRYATIAYFAVFPTIVMYTLCSSKDGLFSAFLLLTVLFFIRYLESGKPKTIQKYGKLFCIAAALMMLFRHNGLYAYIVFAAIFYVGYTLAKKKFKRKKNLLKILVIPVFIFIIVSKLMEFSLSAESGEHQEILTVPIQQLGRLYVYDKESFSEEEKEVLFRYISDEGLSHYTGRLSDILKLYFNNEAYEEDKESFWKLWKDKGLSHPVSYLNSWFLTSYGYWYPGAVINVYKGNTVFTFTYDESSYFGYEVEEPGSRQSLIPVIDDFYRKLSIEKFQQNIPVISLFFAPAAYFFALIYMGILSVKRGRGAYIAPFLLVFMVWLTVLLGPTYLVRYVVYLWYMIPVFIMFAFGKDYPGKAEEL